jgi:thioredoxin
VVTEVNPETLEDEIQGSKLLFVDTWAPWCGPCLALAPVLEELSEKYVDNAYVRFVKLNTQQYPQFAAKHGINAIPCVLVYFEGKPARFELPGPKGKKPLMTDRLIGLRPPDHYEEVIRALLE